MLCCATTTTGWGGDPAEQIVVRLAAWERASAERSPLRPDVDFTGIEEKYTAHELQTAADLYGPVQADQLIRRFTWVDRSGSFGRVVMRGVPRDELTRLFYSAVDVQFDAATWEVQSVVFFDREGRPRPHAIQPPAAPSAGGGIVTTAGFRSTDSQIRLAANFVEPADLLEVPAASDVQVILDRWAQAMHDVRAVDGTFKRFTYDSVFLTEQRAVGRFHFEAPNRGLYVVEPVKAGLGGPSQKLDKQGRPYAIVADDPVAYYWNGTHVVWLDEQARTYQMVPVPESLDSEVRTVGSWDFVWARMAAPQRVLPGVVDVHNEDFLSRYHWSILRQSPRQIILQGQPATQESRYNLSRLQVILDPETFRTTATRVIDAGASREIVHVFEYGTFHRALQPAESKWEPDLTRYRRVEHLQQAPPVSPAE
ncbi:MAG: hypothetical protein DWQ34_20105 [Planctomycetota bacterium]|nr:MAG: hypothetical protein DWQ34_20105 [Planctomycetota bacterium]REJ91130.1 MAG: hypothetical protein DWQ29_05935 [Planctomycetota bacterium]REK28905.1 MAG: hypothetical protein DWQ41_04970 [Planctomycetota bacterium]REK39661.1 MAG: hypothetical protein DWQ45_01975 [Planctomycetota bacterium]